MGQKLNKDKDFTLFKELDEIKNRYERRKSIEEDSLYHPLSPYAFMTIQELNKALLRWVHTCGIIPVSEKKVLEIGCGNGINLLRLIGMGFDPEKMVANELDQGRAKSARGRLPEAVSVVPGDALALDVPDNSFDIVMQSTVFTSILDAKFQEALADKMWRMVAPGGGVLWYDFKYNNPKNNDVKGVSVKRIRHLFPEAKIKTWPITLAPPIGRRVVGKFIFPYHLLNVFPFLRTHILAWIQKV